MEYRIAYLRAGRFRESVQELNLCRDMFDRWKNDLPQVAVRVHYFLGQAYEAGGEDAKAVKEYGKFIDYWKDADSILTVQVNDARLRVARLCSRSTERPPRDTPPSASSP